MTTHNAIELQRHIRMDGLRQQLLVAHSHRNIVKYVSSLSADYSPELDGAPYFFRVTFLANAASTVIRLHTFFDKPHTLSMCNLFDFVEKNITILSEDAYSARLRLSGDSEARIRRLAAKRPMITRDTVQQHRLEVEGLPKTNLRIWRHQLLAHVNLDAVLEQKEIGKTYPIVWAEIDTILAKLHCILNLYYQAYDASGFAWGLDRQYEVKRILDALRNDHKRRRAYAQRLLKKSQA